MTFLRDVFSTYGVIAFGKSVWEIVQIWRDR